MPHPRLQDRFRNLVSSALSMVAETAELDHAGLKGRFREIFVADILRPILSSEFIAGAGLVVDCNGGTSPEADLVIFDRFHVPAVLYRVDEGYFPIEGVYYYGEVKSKLTKANIEDAIRKFRAFRSLRPMPNMAGQLQWAPRFLFAWGSDLTGDIEDELDRYVAVDEAALSDPAATIICVVGKGYCFVTTNPDGTLSWNEVGTADGVQEVVNFVGGIANSLIEFRMQNFGRKFGHYIISPGNQRRLRNFETK